MSSVTNFCTKPKLQLNPAVLEQRAETNTEVHYITENKNRLILQNTLELPKIT